MWLLLSEVASVNITSCGVCWFAHWVLMLEDIPHSIFFFCLVLCLSAPTCAEYEAVYALLSCNKR